MKKIVVMGDANSIWVRDFAAKALLPNGYDLTVFCSEGQNSKFCDYYKEEKIRVVEDKAGVVGKIPVVRGWFETYRFSKFMAKSKPDIIIALYVTPAKLKLMSSPSAKKAEKYAIYIGSDVLRAGPEKCAKMREYIEKSGTNVVCDSKKLSKAYREKINAASSEKIIYFGTGQCENIGEAWENGVDEAKKFFGIPSEKTTICVGYNGYTSQQHPDVAEVLGNVSNRVKENTVFLFPVAYGGNEEYIKSIDEKLSKTGVDYKLLKDFLSPPEVAKLRVATDLYINTQTTDDLSASVIEFLFAGSKMLNCGWIEYPDLEEAGIKMESYGSFPELPSVIDRITEGKIERSRVDYAAIEKFVSWDCCKDEWGKYLKREETNE